MQDGLLLNDIISFEGQGLSLRDLSITYSNGNATVEIIGSRTEAILIIDVAAGSLGEDDFFFGGRALATDDLLL